VSSVIAQIDMNVTLRRAYDTFREQVAAVIIEWLLDLTTCKLGSDGTIIREIIAAELYSPRMKDSSSLTSNPEATRIYADIKDSARLDWLFLYHTRLWRRPRLNIKQIYVSMLSISHEHKLTVGENVFIATAQNKKTNQSLQLFISPAYTIDWSTHTC
jgi:E3 ubiquitin-protein ligase UBR1